MGGELWADAQKSHASLVAQYGQDVEMAIVMQVKATGGTESLNLKATDLVASTIAAYESSAGHGVLYFSGVKLEPFMCWGEVWASSGMVADCVIELEEEALATTPSGKHLASCH